MYEHASYKNLVAYQKAKSLTIETSLYFSKLRFPKTQEFLVIQLLRSVSSIAANIAEGYGRYYDKSYRQFLSIARGSCFETEYWLEIILELGMFDNKTVKVFIEENNQIAKILTTMMKNLERKTQS